MAPKHIAIIMDGNGRWAQARGHSRWFGHIRGAKRVREIVRSARKKGVKALTLFAFSTENWNRQASEREVLWKILKRYLKSELEDLDRNSICLRVIGETEKLDEGLQSLIRECTEKLSHHTEMQLTLALSYGARDELAEACRLFAEDCVTGKAKPEGFQADDLWRYLSTRDLGELAEVDLVIRTSGEQRVSNFLLWQSAYAEYVFSKKPWPEFREADFEEAIREFDTRERRFGHEGAEGRAS